ncbi:hypothetical protein [Streptomyces clavuligerus]|uniref:Secreted protein n=1 Tax=Streptomyces clavuligerus TaxID=1901 RepID=E2Q459_STRCL|nr:hypothetical protein [Streptomyces clavuligerus]ANW18379.1 hypothetical protein BB341_09120 [Streptomyces clavuligerus]AXU12934.1 hypothetical protein D1794_09450 [Streptomyces clavuligerus]EFG08997.1 Secreted protein [Streptomyces clavuligerus]MBY6302861.1 hypothetical protein [Streptomyces clavuligerus]QCS05718.1 hypothetical protein CRV15_08880 [Streptomyces clavuligerus]
MRKRYGAGAPRAVTAALAAVALGLALTACGGDFGDDGDAPDARNPGAVSTATGAGAQDGQSPEPQGDGPDASERTAEALATVEGSDGFAFTITGAERDEGGFLTVSGTVTNTSDRRLPPPIQWNGQERQVKRTGRSFAGMTLVDKTEKKRYYVLRDTEGYPLTTTGLGVFGAGQSADFFAQFPAPPPETASVELQIPLMPARTIELG